MNQAVETLYWKTSYKLYFYLRRGFGATEQPQPRWAMPPQALFLGQEWLDSDSFTCSSFYLEWLLMQCLQTRPNTCEALSFWIGFVVQSTTNAACLFFIVLVLQRLPFSSPENLSLGFLIKLPLVLRLWTDTSRDTAMRSSGAGGFEPVTIARVSPLVSAVWLTQSNEVNLSACWIGRHIIHVHHTLHKCMAVF